MNELETACLRPRKIGVDGVAVIKFRVSNGGTCVLTDFSTNQSPATSSDRSKMSHSGQFQNRVNSYPGL